MEDESLFACTCCCCLKIFCNTGDTCSLDSANLSDPVNDSSVLNDELADTDLFGGVEAVVP